MTLELLLGLAMAMAMHQAFRGRGALRTIVLVPWAVLTVVTAITWQTIFEPNLGLVNTVLKTLHLPGGNTVWLGENGWAMAVLVFADVWKTAPFMALLHPRRAAGDPRRHLRRGEGRRRHGVAALPRDHAAAADARRSSWR